MEGFSEHFSFEELTNSEGHPNLVPKNRIDAQKYILSGKKLALLLENIRHVLRDEPLKVNSGFRNNDLNTAIYIPIFVNQGMSLQSATEKAKAKKSNHNLFEAVDITPSNMTVKEAFKILMQAREAGLLPTLRKVLQEGSWLHCEVSTSAGDYRGFWTSNDGNKTFTRVA